MIRRPPRSTQSRSSAASDVYKRQLDKDYEVYSQKFKREDLDDNTTFNPQVLPEEYLTKPQEKHTFIYVSTIQRMAINPVSYTHLRAHETRHDLVCRLLL